MSVEIKEDEATPLKSRELKIAKCTTWIWHLFGFHSSCCRWAGKWSLGPHKKIRGPFCSGTNLPL